MVLPSRSNTRKKGLIASIALITTGSSCWQVTKRKHVSPPQAQPAAADDCGAAGDVPPSTVKRRRMALERQLADAQAGAGACADT